MYWGSKGACSAPYVYCGGNAAVGEFEGAMWPKVDVAAIYLRISSHGTDSKSLVIPEFSIIISPTGGIGESETIFLVS